MTLLQKAVDGHDGDLSGPLEYGATLPASFPDQRGGRDVLVVVVVEGAAVDVGRADQGRDAVDGDDLGVSSSAGTGGSSRRRR
jgi:hypothetical protein